MAAAADVLLTSALIIVLRKSRTGFKRSVSVHRQLQAHF